MKNFSFINLIFILLLIACSGNNKVKEKPTEIIISFIGIELLLPS
jgi:predicted component of type VI protein secretion system